MKTFKEHGIDIPGTASGEIRTVCPECNPTRRHKNERDLSVNIAKKAWHCHHCGWSGCLEGEKTKEEIRSYFQPRHKHVDLPDDMLEYLRGRGLMQKTLADNGVCFGEMWDHQAKQRVQAIKFPFFKGGKVVNAKYRSLDKRFSQEKNAEACLYRFDAIQGCEELIVCEGECDALACYEAGLPNATSVPNGAPAPNAKDYAKEFTYLESAKPIFDAAKKIILAVDNDAPGKVLEQELARRIGIDKCWRVHFPSDCKDANDVLIRYGKTRLREIIAEAKPYPVAGIFTPDGIRDLVLHLYDYGQQQGVSTGWQALDPFYKVKTGQVTIITGIPGSGKSNFLDALMVNLAERNLWSFAVFSPENWPLERHAQSIIEKLSRMPFDRSGFHTGKRRISREELQEMIDLIEGRFFFIMPEEDAMTVDAVLEKVRVAVMRHGIKGVVIDPWNELDHAYGNLTETQYISEMLGKIRRFARRNDVHIWIVAHPQKLMKDNTTGKYKPPTMYEISGGAHWRNKADVGICVHRPDMMTDETYVLIQKVRFREVGKLGGVQFRYCRDTGNYTDVGPIIGAAQQCCDTDKGGF